MTPKAHWIKSFLQSLIKKTAEVIPQIRIGKIPQNPVERNTLIFLPLVLNRICCGLTGIVAFQRADKSKALPADMISELESAAAQMAQTGFSADSPEPDRIDADYLGGPDTVSMLYSKIRELKQTESFYELFADANACGRLSALLKNLEELAQKELQGRDQAMGRLAPDVFDMVSTRIETLRDAKWSLKTELLDNMEKIRVMTPGIPELARGGLAAAQQINSVLNSIDRLEVRGRDSAGLSLMFVLEDSAYFDLESRINAAGHSEEFSRRTNQNLLLHKSVSVRHLKNDPADPQVSVALTYKVAAEIGRLGDNIAYIRDELAADPVLQFLLIQPHRRFNVSAHTRWASVGEVNEFNCHPMDAQTRASLIEETGIIHVSLNGDIDNYQALQKAHEAAGMAYPAEITCDTKIIPVHIAGYLKKGHDIAEAFRLAVNDFEGSHAICMQSDLAPGKLFLALKGSGQAVFVGLGPDFYIPTSEVYGFAEETPYFLKMDGEAVHKDSQGRLVSGQIFVIDADSPGGLSGVTAMFYNGAPIELTDADIRKTQLTSRDIDRQDFDHYFLKEISEAPASVRRTLENRWKIINTDGRRYEIALDETTIPQALLEKITHGRIRQILFIGQGTAGVAASACANLMRYYLDEPTMRIEALKSSELSGFVLNESDGRDMSDTLLVPISQSGTTTDTNRAVDMVRKKGASSVCIVNRRDSDLTFKTSGVLYTSSGRDIEMSVASTKAFYSQIIAGAVLALYIAQTTGRRSHAFVSNEVRQMIQLPDIMEQVLSMKKQVRASANRLALQRTYWATVGSGPNKAAADEIRIKLSELCYKTISSDFVEDKKHIDLSSEPLIIVCAAGTRRSVIGDIVKDTAIFRSHKALPVVIADANEYRFDAYAEDVFRVPSVSEHFAPIVNTLVGHMWGYYAALTINEGSHFLHLFREEIRETIKAYAKQNLDIYEIALEKPFREKILRFYNEFRKRQAENGLAPTMGINGSTNLVLLLKYLSGRLPVADFEIDFGVKGTARNMFDLLFASLAEAINTMARPVDAIKHQAKTVTVGTSRIEEKAEGLIFDMMQDLGFTIEHLTLNNILVIKNLQQILDHIKGWTLYRISGVNLMGEPTEETTIEVVDKQGSSAAISSRAEEDRTLKGTKRIIVREGNVYMGKGRKDDRSILVIPLISGDPSRPNMVEHLLLFDVAFRPAVDLASRVKALGGKHEHIKNIVQENNIVWNDELLDQVPVDELFGRSAEKIAEQIVERVS
ncbi:MAG: SIS domain-containing protein [Desulfobacterales bacterium]|nr:SIS domain-containing protein [Desulfobacterales bacterium]